MKPRLILLVACFILFYLFTDLNWQLGNFLSGHGMYNFLHRKHGILSEVSALFCFSLYNIVAYLIFYNFYFRQRAKVTAILVYLLAGIPLMILMRYLIQEVLVFNIWGYHNYSADMRQPARYFLDNIYFSIYYSLFGIVFFFIQFSNYGQKKQNELLLQNRNAELSFLRSQVNPHFLFNSLNNVYTLVYQNSAKALPSIGQLSELLRYMLYEKEELVPLSKEVKYLRNFIDLQLMRYDHEPAIRTQLDDASDSDLKISPLTLIPFVENAFKHGDLKDETQPLLIELALQEKQLYFKVLNKKGNFNKDETGGIGLENVQKRLELIYGTRHNLQISETETLFSIELSIDLHD